MLRFLVLTSLLIAAAYMLAERGGPNPLDVRQEGRQVIVEAELLRARFQPGAAFDETYMLFGGVGPDDQGHFVTALYAGLASRHVAFISQRHPDFYMCASPGASSAKALVENLSLIARSGATRATLRKGLARFDEGIRTGGERTCVRVAGKRLHLSDVATTRAEFPLPREAEQSYRSHQYYLVDEASLVDCQEIGHRL